MDGEDKRLEEPKRPESPEWALQRAFDDGERRAIVKLKRWLNGRTNYSPDGAENTEE